MAKERPFLATLNGGEVSPLTLGRIDLARMRFTAETMKNAIPKVIGAMSLRSGLRYLNSTRNDARAHHLPFIFSAEDTALVELTNLAMRIVIAGTVLTRPAVSTVVTNGDFSSATGWTLTTTGGGVATISGGVLTMRTLVRGSTTKCLREVTVALADRNVEHGLRIVITRGPVKFRCGSTSGGDEYIRETTLNTGTYSLSITPTANFFVQFSCESEPNRIVDSITVEAAGAVEMTTPWPTADLNKVRHVQSGDVIFCANSSGSYAMKRIERRDTRSWGITDHEIEDGPYRGKTADITLSNSATIGNGTLTASAPFFRAGHVGALFEITHQRTDISNTLAGENRYSDAVRVSGVRRFDEDGDGTSELVSDRRVTFSLTNGGWAGTVSWLTSTDNETWTEWRTSTGGNGFSNIVRYPGVDNTVTYFRLGFLPDGYTSGSATVTMSYKGGGGRGVVRITSVTDSTHAEYEVVKRVYSTGITDEWQEGLFSGVNGWPTAVDLFDGRLWLGSDDKINGTVSDDFTSYDLDTEGDSGPIIRSVANGPVNGIRWILGLARLCIGTAGAEPIARSSSFDEPMTPTNFSIKDASTQGSADIQAIKVDRTGVFIQRSRKRAYLLAFDVESQDYTSRDITRYNPTILEAGVVGMVVQRQPDTRIWFWLDDGTAACLVYEPTEDVIAWCRFETDGLIEDIVVLPNVEGDDVYMTVKRVIEGQDKRYRERLAYDHEGEGGEDNFLADAFVTDDLVATDVVTGLSHLEGEDVVAWVDGQAMLDADGRPELFTVDAGQITLPSQMTGQAVVGLPYTGQWKSTKLAYGAQMGTAVSQPKIIKDFAAVLYKTHLRGLRYGRDFDHLTDLPLVIKGEVMPFDTLLEDYDAAALAFEGTYDTDSRICFQMEAPLPCTMLGLAGAVETHERG